MNEIYPERKVVDEKKEIRNKRLNKIQKSYSRIPDKFMFYFK